MKLSPNFTKPRNKKISKITIHHMAGNLSVEACGNTFLNRSRQASANYGVGTDGRVGLYVEEEYRSWASSSPDNDHMAVTIEVANDGGAPQWHVSDKALEKTIELCVDICIRNGIEKLNFTGNKKGNLTMHKYFTATNCPGPYLESKFSYIANEVNRRLTSKNADKLTETNDIVWSLNQRGIMTNKQLWLKKCVPDSDAYWLAYKVANMTKNSGERKNKLETVNDIVWELNQRGIINDKGLWLRLLNEDGDLYWLAYKAANMTVNK